MPQTSISRKQGQSEGFVALPFLMVFNRLFPSPISPSSLISGIGVGFSVWAAGLVAGGTGVRGQNAVVLALKKSPEGFGGTSPVAELFWQRHLVFQHFVGSQLPLMAL